MEIERDQNKLFQCFNVYSPGHFMYYCITRTISLDPLLISKFNRSNPMLAAQRLGFRTVLLTLEHIH